MSSHTDSDQSKSESQSEVPPFVPPLADVEGPDTVYNPQRNESPAKEYSAQSDSQPPVNQPPSAVWNRLFPPPDADRDALLSPQGMQIGHFVIQQRIASGGMGSVFRALDTQLDRAVALKVLTPTLSRDPAAILRFRNEARSAAQLDHENIARVYFFGEDEGLHFIAFEFVSGTNVRQIIQQQGKLDPAQAVNFTLQVATALKHTAAAGVVHRDIKPSNVIITPYGRAKLVDLGLARKQATDASAELTMAGTTLGTFDYISPEQAKDPRNVDIRSDIYSLGCTLYHMLTGEPPYPEGTVLQKLLDHQAKSAPDPAQKNARVPASLSAAVRKMMESDPDNRFQTPESLIFELQRVARELGIDALNPEGLVWKPPRSPLNRFLTNNLMWIFPVAILVLIVVLLEQFPTIGVDQPPTLQGPEFPQLPAPATDSTSATAPDLPRTLPLDKKSPNAPAEAASQSSAANEVTPSTERAAAVPDAAANKSTKGDEKMVAVETPLLPSLTSSDPNNIFDDPNLQPLMLTRQEESLMGPIDINDSTPPAVGTLPLPTAKSKPTEVAMTPAESLPPGPQPASEVPPISMISVSGEEVGTYKSLEAACSSAEDGSVIELRFNGRRQEPPLAITNQNITIRGAKGYQPVIEFRSVDVPAEGYQTRMMTVKGGSLNLVNLHFVLPIEKEVRGDKWSLFSLEGVRRLRFQNVSATVVNPTRRDVTLFALTPDSRSPAGEIPMMNGGVEQLPWEFEFTNCFFRGGCQVFTMAHTEPGRVTCQNTVIAVSRGFFRQTGEPNAPRAGGKLELKMDHVTCLLGGSLIELESGDQFARELLPVQVTARNNIFASTVGGEFIAMTGQTAGSDFQKLLQYDGEKNYFSQFAVFWAIRSLQGTADFDTLDFEQWINWGEPITEVGSHQAAVVWQQRVDQVEPWDMTADSFRLDRNAIGNRAVEGADDGSDAGANLAELPPVPAAEPLAVESATPVTP